MKAINMKISMKEISGISESENGIRSMSKWRNQYHHQYHRNNEIFKINNNNQ
jgi:hypothetical protein